MLIVEEQKGIFYGILINLEKKEPKLEKDWFYLWNTYN